MTASNSSLRTEAEQIFSTSSSVTPLHSSAPAIVAEDISMVFQSGQRSVPVLADIQLQVPAGDIQLLMGPSGSGKTTLLSILGGILQPTSGRVCLLGEDITQLSRSQRSQFRLQNIGFIFQGFNLFPALTAIENVELALQLQGMAKPSIRKTAQHWLEQVGLGHTAHQLPKNLSGGQKQRVAIARALAGEPQLIMADEPTAALDSKSGHDVINLLRKLAKEKGSTVLMVTHDPRIMDVADRVTLLEDGKIPKTGLP